VAGLAAAADALPAADPLAVFDEVVAAEVAFWDMALA
jgi:thiaminase/transcriptional activator TenA